MEDSTLDVQREQANQIVEDIIAQKNEINAILGEAKGLLSTIKTTIKNNQKLVDSLDDIDSTTSKAIQDFNGDKARISKLLTTANNFYKNKFLPLSAKIEDKKTGFSAKIKDADKEYNRFKTIKEECSAKYKEIVELGRGYKAKVAELRKIEQAMLALYKASEADNTSIRAFYTQSQDALSKITESYNTIVAIEGKCKTSESNIVSAEKNSASLSAKIQTLHTSSEEKLAEIEVIYGIAHETGLSGGFEKRRNSLGEELKRWEKYILGTSVALLAGILALFTVQLGLNEWAFDDVFDFNFYVRFLIFSPVVYYLYFVSTQYNKAKKLHDKYAFKTTLSAHIKSHIELLTQKGYFKEKGQSDKVLDFILSGFSKIYNEPYADDNYKMKIKIANCEIELQKELIKQLSSALEQGGSIVQNTVDSIVK